MKVKELESTKWQCVAVVKVLRMIQEIQRGDPVPDRLGLLRSKIIDHFGNLPEIHAEFEDSDFPLEPDED